MGAPKPHLLVLNAAEGRLQALLARLEEQPGQEGQPAIPVLSDMREWIAPSQGAELLAPGLRHMLEGRRLVPGDIRRIACVRGPGGFTGLRLVLATAAALARTTGALQAGFDYLPLLAAQAANLMRGLERGRTAGNGVCPLFWTATHARRDLVHVQAFSLRREPEAGHGRSHWGMAPPGTVVEERTGLLVLTLEEAEACTLLEEAPGFLLGSGLTRNRAFWEQAEPVKRGRLTLLPSFFDHPCSEALLSGAAALSYAREDIAPFYARPSDAEENLERIAASLGLDPAAARQRLEELGAGTGLS